MCIIDIFFFKQKTAYEISACLVGSGNHWFLMKQGAHHVDLRAPTSADPAEITAVRAEEEKIIRGWIDEFASSSSSSPRA
eukprot:NODE_27771_length_501_cov_1.609626.p2 GENE.NODE_27771_length_501_cov_1.609626~~NODE_27771_length_501_cov_1.609626.p2  ORF type:complete len:80 (+),score=17.01 NODE_27771_length_501_cov_1.609626:134-373(+)